MNRWSNPFVSLGAAALLVGCRSAPPEQPAFENAFAAAAASAAPAATPGATAKPAATAAATATPATGTTPVPDAAARQYADALNLMRAGRTTDAELALEQMAAAFPEFSGPPLNLGLLYLEASKLPQAESAFKAALDRNPDNAVAANELGIALRREGKFPEAEAAYQRTITADPNYAPAYLNLGVLYDLYLGEPQKALDSFEHYLQLAGENKQVAGWVVELRKRVGGAAQAAKKEPS